MTIKRPGSDLGANSKKPKSITDFFAAANEKASKKQSKPKKQEPKPKTIEMNAEVSVETLKSTADGTNDIGEVSVSVEETANGTALQEDEGQEEEEKEDENRQHNDTLQDSNKDANEEFCKKMGFDKEQWLGSLSPEEKLLLALEINTLHITWLAFLHKEITKPYFIKLKKFLRTQMASKTVFPPPGHIYSWSHLTPLPEVKCLILGQDPYHNFNQAHGLAFLVLEPTRPPPSLLNIYKTLKIDFPNYQIPDYNQLQKLGRPGGGNLTKWAKRGVLMLNACLTVEAHKANSHANQGWERFTEEVIRTAINYSSKERDTGFVIMAWGSPAQKRVANFNKQLHASSTPFLVLTTVHPSPLSASRGFFDLQVFKKCNEWLKEHGEKAIDWGIVDGNVIS